MKITSKVVESVWVPKIDEKLPCREIKLYKNVCKRTGKTMILYPIKIETLGKRVFRIENVNGDIYYVLSIVGFIYGFEHEGYICRLVEGELVEGNTVEVYSLLAFSGRRYKTYMQLKINKLEQTEDHYYRVYGENYYKDEWHLFRGYVYAP